MNTKGRGILVAFAAVVVGCFMFAVPASAKTLNWHRWDSDITINKDGSFTVRETYEIQFIGGSFTFGYRNIPINDFTSIRNVSVSSGGVTYVENSSNEPNTFEWGMDGDQYNINWYFPAVSDQTEVFTVEYTVLGGIAVDANQGDKFFWKAVGPDHDFAIDSSTITITAPPGANFDPSVGPAYFGADAEYKFAPGNQSVTVVGHNIPASTAFEVGIRFPHGYIPNQPPAWQAIEAQKSIFNVVFGVLGGLVLVVGLIGVYLLWMLNGRDPSVGAVPEYLTEPPSDLPPGLVGTLIDERADIQDIIATLVDLARRGVIDMQEETHKTFGIVSTSDFIFHKRADYDGALRDYEKVLISEVFGTRQQIALSELRNRFYTSVPKLQNLLYADSIKEGLFSANPKSVRSRYLAFGVVGLVLAFGLYFCLAPLALDLTDIFLCPFAGLGAASLALIFVSNSMVAKTRKGAEEAAKWRAFREYLTRAEKYTDLQSITEQFDKYLPFAIVFGLDRAWISKFAALPNVPTPGWYFPSVIGYHPGIGRMGGGLSSGSLPQSGMPDLSGKGVGSGPSLDRMSGQMLGGLSSMSNGLFAMLNTTASTFTSVPQSSSGGSFHGGGGFGGGFHGGGGGGGGGAGFG